MDIIGNTQREAALEHGAEIIRHYLDKVSDSLNRVRELLKTGVATPDLVVNEINRAANIAGKAQQASNIWKGLAIDLKKNSDAHD